MEQDKLTPPHLLKYRTLPPPPSSPSVSPDVSIRRRDGEESMARGKGDPRLILILLDPHRGTAVSKGGGGGRRGRGKTAVKLWKINDHVI